jgi:hypothetical protein
MCPLTLNAGEAGISQHGTRSKNQDRQNLSRVLAVMATNILPH